MGPPDRGHGADAPDGGQAAVDHAAIADLKAEMVVLWDEAVRSGKVPPAKEAEFRRETLDEARKIGDGKVTPDGVAWLRNLIAEMLPPAREPDTGMIILSPLPEISIQGSIIGRRQGGPRNFPKKADWTAWRPVDQVQLVDAVLLSLDVDPRLQPRSLAQGNNRYELFKSILPMVGATNWFRLEERARMAVSWLGTILPQTSDGNDLSTTVRLPVFGSLADKQGLKLPNEFPRLESAASAVKTGWPWGVYETPRLKELAAAAKHFWADGYDPKSAPTKEQVKNWLLKRGSVSARIAEAIAQILRADDIPAGPRKTKHREK